MLGSLKIWGIIKFQFMWPSSKLKIIDISSQLMLTLSADNLERDYLLPFLSISQNILLLKIKIE